MAGPYVFQNIVLGFGGHRMSLHSNEFTCQPSREKVPASMFEDKVDKIRKGRYSADLSFKGGTSNALELAILPALVDDDTTAGTLPLVGCIQPGGAAGTIAALMTAKLCSFKMPKDGGKLAEFQADFALEDWIGLGYVMFQGVGTAGLGAPATGTIVLAGAIPDGYEAVFALNVFGATGTTPTLDGKVQSAAAVGFASPTDRGTFAQSTAAPQSQLLRVAGPVTDTYWRVNWTAVGGTTPNFVVLAAMAIRDLAIT